MIQNGDPGRGWPDLFRGFFYGHCVLLFWQGETEFFQRSLAVIVAVIVAVMAACFLVNFFILMPPPADILEQHC